MLAPIEGAFQGKRNSTASMFQNMPSFIKARTDESQPLGSWTKILARLHFWTSMSHRSVMEAWTLEATLHGRLAFSFPTGLHESHTTSVDVLNTFNENKSKTHLAIQYTRCSQKWMWSHFCDMFLYFVRLELPKTLENVSNKAFLFQVIATKFGPWPLGAWQLRFSRMECSIFTT